MEISSNHLYQNLGKLFFAVAAADNVVRDEEFNALSNLIVSHWRDLDDVKDDFGTDASYQIEIVFEWLKEQFLDAETCFQQFVDFKSDHESLFNSKINRTIWRTVLTIADSFHGTNKDERAMLDKIKQILH
ncbi:MAG: hypothetical protein BM563_09650 [Bacteroidetes bacterium MedPE-SWsnd-G1]|nr:MAG: hypothetical protein BM563_09650 [Bacteroidetes bacterium MedPE-SWsnd-G1]